MFLINIKLILVVLKIQKAADINNLIESFVNFKQTEEYM